MNRRELLQRLSAVPFVSMLAPLLHGQSKKGQSVKELRFVNVEDFWAWVKQTQTPEKLAELEAWYKQWCERRSPGTRPTKINVSVDEDGKFLGAAIIKHRVEWERLSPANTPVPSQYDIGPDKPQKP